MPQRNRSQPWLTVRRLAAGADLLSRMLVSYAVRPPDLPPEAVAQFLSTAIVAGVLTAPADVAPALPTS